MLFLVVFERFEDADGLYISLTSEGSNLVLILNFIVSFDGFP